ncbi:1-deoxy-D-xylulose-5-phosphate synthase [Tessaracoccus sp. SD287]|uniref:1-deoxy-D-xylulose-5-phosphate synthase n=1 Tax=Tessaracoccus sp. SD287 TaxID=2782008 RepID=UPI001A95AC27|nr:1-deoxy-D-xylulose-5-phosphate synthase [Tessaracoccus sp. SD287]MBO1029781.1 1-deoxy-D-xylulose-5-phosphate synthase [Tessaracoccus sp. SD287]
MSLLESITAPSDLRALTKPQLEQLAGEIREFLIRSVSRTGGHLGPNLGVVELSLALHRVFDSPTDPIIFDTGHQSYVHKLLTGRREGFGKLRQQGGLSGYPSRAESDHDWVENSHASTSLSWAEGMAKAFKLRGVDRHVVAVIGDGALTGGMAWEALNNIAAQPDLPLVIIVNDNGRSYTPTVGGVANHLSALRTSRTYEQTLGLIKRSVSKAPLVGKPTYDMLHGIKTGIKDILAPQSMFSDLGLKYVGPIDGHDLAGLELVLQRARDFQGPVIIHCITRKGKGFRAAEEHEEDQFHAVGKIDSVTGVPLVDAVQATWTEAFAEEMVRIGAERPDVVAITAAMLHPTGLARFAAAYPERTFDVGIAEQHAVASAAGMASAGLHPVIALYATFVNRAFDQMLMDVALHKLGVTLVLDRSGITGTDGASHNGMWDISLLGLVPGLRLAAPRDQQRLVEALRTAVDVTDAPTVVRYSKEKLPDPIPAIASHDGLDELLVTGDPEVLVVGHGQFVGLALQVGHRLGEQGIGVRVVDPVWTLPINPALVELAGRHRLVVTVEDNVVVGGAGDQLAQALRQADIGVQVMDYGIPDEFLEHASRGEVLDALGLNAQQISRAVIEKYARLCGTAAETDAQRQLRA